MGARHRDGAHSTPHLFSSSHTSSSCFIPCLSSDGRRRESLPREGPREAPSLLIAQLAVSLDTIELSASRPRRATGGVKEWSGAEPDSRQGRADGSHPGKELGRRGGEEGSSTLLGRVTEMWRRVE